MPGRRIHHLVARPCERGFLVGVACFLAVGLFNGPSQVTLQFVDRAEAGRVRRRDRLSRRQLGKSVRLVFARACESIYRGKREQETQTCRMNRSERTRAQPHKIYSQKNREAEASKSSKIETNQSHQIKRRPAGAASCCFTSSQLNRKVRPGEWNHPRSHRFERA